MAEQKSFVERAWPVLIFILMTVQRAGHNTLIEFAKNGQKDFPFPPSTIIFFAQVGCVSVAWAMTYFVHGFKEFKQCLDPKGIFLFLVVGFWYCMGDVFEMEANRHMDSATYTVLSQSKLLITALLMICVMGKYQTQLQWSILVVTTLGMAEYVCVDMTHSGKSPKDSLLGITLALGKVVISCYVAVLNERAMKKDPNVFLVQFVWVKMAQLLCNAVYMLGRDGQQIYEEGLFTGYDYRAWTLILAGFVVKALLTQYIIKILDSLLKNICEVLSVLLVYFNRILFMNGVFYPDSFIAAITVMLAVYSYVLTKQGAAKKPEKKESDLKEPLLGGSNV